MPLYLPNALAATALVAKQLDVTSVCLRIVCADETQKCALSRSVVAAQSPMLSLIHSPREVVEDSARPVTYGDVGKTEDGKPLSRPLSRPLSGSPRGGERTRDGEKRRCGENSFVLDINYAVDEVWNVRGTGEDEDDLKTCALDEVGQSVAQLLASVDVQTDEGGIEDEEARVGLQGFPKLVFAQFAAGKRYDGLPIYTRHIVVDVMLIPPLLIVVSR